MKGDYTIKESIGDFTSKEDYNNSVDTIGFIESLFMYTMANGNKTQKKRCEQITQTYIKRLKKLNNEINEKIN